MSSSMIPPLWLAVAIFAPEPADPAVPAPPTASPPMASPPTASPPMASDARSERATPPPSAPPGAGGPEPGEESPDAGEAGGPAETSPDARAPVPGTPDAEEDVEAAPLPPRGAAAPGASDPRAWGGAYETPLPAAPPPEDPARLTDRTWRGRFWLSVAAHVQVPVAGRAPARGATVAFTPEAMFGWRISPVVSLHASISNSLHDVVQVPVEAEDGTELGTVPRFGRITALDLATVRLQIPRPRRVEPWFDIGAGVGVYRGPLSASRRATGLARVGAGVDLWLSPIFTLSPGFMYRVIVIDALVGHAVRGGVEIGIHW